MKRELLVGCGRDHNKRVMLPGHPNTWDGLTTLDFNDECGPDVVHDLEEFPYPFEDDSFDEVHAYEVLEHLGSQGNWKFFFDQFAEFYRILKPNGLFCATTPWWSGRWAWGDPGHTRVITPDTLAFLDKSIYEDENAMLTDYRFYWKGNFVRVHGEKQRLGPVDDVGDKEFGSPDHFIFILRAVK